ncbi:kinase-like domain-containing protein [Aspergillus minisclerotigenes]|uniref:non-specific serine/threonine protein kinase n=1 Tax=Aspergillus minisclerotigenes TaxID=656917 RepID=A0A5N6JER8_9EURO|nr:kinase-like domain-containing protein [Aspergillus minisclerotigenes]
MVDAQKEAEAKIDLLTSSNGPLVTGIYKISSLTKEVKMKRQLLTKKLTTIQFAAKQFDWTILLDAASTLVSLSADPKSIVDTVKQGYEIYKKVTDESTAKNLHGDAVKKEYIIDQLAQCSDTLESLEKAFTTRKDNQIEIDDPGALKIMATKGNIEKILREFKNAIVEKDKKDIESALDDYIAVALNRNNAVLDYNSSLQLLFEASNAREYSKSQAESLGQRRHTLDPNTPAILFWLRKTRDNMRLQLMQRLNDESRAIRFWGLKKHLDYSSPGPLRSFIELRDGQSKLNAAYEDSLNSYANNIRVTWPREEKEKGLFYILSNAELEAFKERQRLTTSKGDDGVYSASIRLEPGAPPFGPDRADVRINQVRLWLLGVEVKADNAGRKQLMVKIAHSGNETLENTDRQALGFSHDAVNIQFEYNTAKVQTSDDFKTDVVFGKQGLENDWSGGDSKPTASTFAAIGPFTEWRFSIRESENVGLDMRSVTAAYVEFRGANRPFSAGRKIDMIDIPYETLVDNEWRFEPITLPCEWVEDYRPGGYHPVVLGDVFNNGQYKVIRKLGEVHLLYFVVHRYLFLFRNSGYVALKILVSEISRSTTELRILRHITEVAPAEGGRHITRLLGEFEHHGPNGVHRCLVFEPMGPSVNTMVEELPQFKPRMRGMKIRYPLRMAKSILKQSLQALAFLHENGISHGDFQPGNILFTLDDIGSTPEDMLRQEENVQAESISPPVQRLDGKEDKWAPRYLCVAQPLVPFTFYAEDFKVKLSDMGGAYFFTDPPTKPVTPLGLRAPELILTGAVDNTLDIWSFGCLVFELITGQPLFCIPGSDFEDDDHLLSLTDRLGALPDELFKHWKTSSLYFTSERKLFNCQLGGVAPGEEPLMLEQTSMEELFDQAGPDLDQEEAHKVKALIRWILQYDPAKRPSPAEILSHPWFCEINVGSNLSKA